MARGIVIALLIMIAMLLVLDTPHGIVRAKEKEDADNLARILQNQKLMLEKLGGIDKKIDQLKMRVR